MPEIGPREEDFIIKSKKTASAFRGTDLDNLLRILKVDTLVFIGVNTNTCILSSAFDSFNRGFSTIVISDCVSSMYGEDLHFFALQNISRCIGWVITTEEFKTKLQAPTELPES
jgi:nicotinamidase-related amidase